MSKTYTLSATSINCGYHSSIASGYWNTIAGSDSNGYMVGYYGSAYRWTNIMFDTTTLATLRSKTVTSVKLTLTLANAARIRESGWTVLPIGYKLNSTATTTSTGTAWTRSDKDSTAQSTDVAGYLCSSGSSAYTAAVGDTLTITMASNVPVYGYVLGVTSSATEYYTVKISAAKLIVVTNETDYTMKLAYSANGGSGAPSTQSTTVTTTGTPSTTFTVSSTVPTRTGYSFTEWNTASDGSGTSYDAGDSITVSGSGSTTVTLYAIWEQITYTVTYNKGSYGTGTNTTATKYYGTTLTLKTAIFTRTGYSQAGWSTSDGGSLVYALGASYTTNAAITLYPYWEASYSSISASSGTIGTAMTITITRSSSDYTHTVTYSFGSASGTVGSDIATSVSWTPPMSLCSEYTVATSGTCVLTCQTYDSDGTLIGSSTCSVTLSIPSSVKCTVSSVALADTVTSVASQFSAYVQTKSKLSVTVTTDDSDAYGASVSAYSISINGQTLTTNGATTSALTTSGTNSYTVTITDTRGRTSTYTGSFSVLAYSAPTVSQTSERDSSTTTTINVSYTWSISELDDLNTKTIRIRYRLSGGSWTTATTITASDYADSDSYSITGTDANGTYEVQVQAIDFFTTISDTETVASVGDRVLYYSSSDQTITLHSDNPKDGYDHEYFPAQFHDVVDITNRRAYATLSSAGWYRVCQYAGTDSGAITGGTGEFVEFHVQKSTSSENHSIEMRMNSSSDIVFVNERSHTVTQLISKIRYTYDSTNLLGYVDIYYTGSVNRAVGVDFVVHGSTLAAQARWTSCDLEAVDDAPSGETVVTTYTFADEGFVPNQSIVTSYGDLSYTGYKLAEDPTAVSCSDSTWTNVASITLDSAGRWLVYFVARFASDANGYRRAHLSASSASSTQLRVMVSDFQAPPSGTYAMLKAMDTFTITASTTYYLNVYQTSGSALSCLGKIYAVRLT